MISADQLTGLWDFSRPEVSEERFRAAMKDGDDDDRFILSTQVARSYGLRGDFAKAKEVLDNLGPEEPRSHRVQAWYFLERGRALVSATHDQASLTPADLAEARRWYEKAIASAQASGQESLVIDAMHMMVLVDRDPADQLKWNRTILEFIAQSSDEDTKGWLGPIHNNLGYALHLNGQFDEALVEFGRSRNAYEARNDWANMRIENWMIAWTYRVMGRTLDALDLQRRNEEDNDRAGTPDVYVFDELAQLYELLEDRERSELYRKRSEVLRKR